MSQNGIGDTPFAYEAFLVNVPGSKAVAKVSCHWRLPEPVGNVDGQRYFYSLDLLMLIEIVACGNNINEIVVPYATGTVLENLVHACYKVQKASGINQVEQAVKVILVPSNGYLCRTDVLELRMRNSAFVGSVIRFPAPSDGHFSLVAAAETGKCNFLTLLSSAPGALLAKQSLTSHPEAFAVLEEELRVRLSFNWVLPTKPKIRKVALIGGRPVFDIHKVIRPSRNVRGSPSLRNDFVAVDMTNDTELPLRIAEALKGKGIHGIVTFSDEVVVATAKAAEILGLPTESPQAILCAHNKYETRKLLDTNNTQTQTLRLESAAQLDDPPVAMKVAYMQYPLIVKPCRDGASRGVRKVNNYAGMRQAVQQLEESGFSKYGILLETYIDGPEVDANFVLWEGEVLFCEISDELPCQVDAMDATISDNFAETIMLLPSRLDPKETQLIQSSLHQSLLKLGFRSGVFHVEARVRNSSMRYIQTDGILDLADAAPSTAEKAKPDVFLIEVNARPPGLQCVFATTYTYGVDFYGLQFLRAPEDRERFMALSRAFSCHAQYWCASNDSYPPPKHHSTQ
ncbi:Carnosine synthase 1 [Trichophyton interdigitale]|uniref:ATP-grasp fold n=1 Tax=Trichophyton interdigitale TaxID=101480 RepID=A0A9P5CYK9_9EURO|nr:ATP-grasp fold [Trichophyton interdigitale]KAF3894816.1 ATP-grasp fold [Trichophyton interdigitale]KAG8208519.1 Carnosine synthase 1 [Trichophyton interdigitale]